MVPSCGSKSGLSLQKTVMFFFLWQRMGLLMFSRAELQYLNVEHPVEIKGAFD